VNIGSQVVVCTDSAGYKDVPGKLLAYFLNIYIGFYGKFYCPIATKFCKVLEQNKAFCENGCTGRGACGAGHTCVCEEGWTGKDCSQPVQV